MTKKIETQKCSTTHNTNFNQSVSAFSLQLEAAPINPEGQKKSVEVNSELVLIRESAVKSALLAQ